MEALPVPTTSPVFKKLVEVGEVISVGAQAEVIDALLAEKPGDSLMVSAGEFVKAHPDIRVVGVDRGLPSSFRVCQVDFTYFGEFELHRIGDPQRDGVMFVGESPERALQVVAEKVGNKKNERFALHRVD